MPCANLAPGAAQLARALLQWLRTLLPQELGLSQPDTWAAGWLPSTASGQTGDTTDSVRAAIARASQAKGVDFSYMLAQARLESSLNPNARASTSSAAGLYQFTNATWLDTVQKHGGMLGIGAGGVGLADPTSRAQLLALRHDPDASAMMAASLASDNQNALTGILGRQPDSTELYLAHFLGVEGAGKFLSALNTDPSQSAAAVLPRAAGANRSIFFDDSGSPRSVGQVMAMLRNRMNNAMQAEGGAGGFDSLAMAGVGYGNLDYASVAQPGFGPLGANQAPAEPFGGPIAQEFASARQEMGGTSFAPVRSMADTLEAAFGAVGNALAPAPQFVRNAYSSLKALGL
ncbi:lytic transglycosylase domain-containing protein [Novosphingobium umbonatum]|uniref:Lytic transglycosylase domain-containing protein n=1 Tax=Novosphingobium umbonatum TaxID=1908524 RepID=A0A437ND76_9SPHN|nr:lytic transglycosylase domain-containing protein [Novosphingobium umbonatum]